MKNIAIFNSEKRDGIADLITNNVVSFASDITSLKVAPTQTETFLAVARANPNQPDLVHRYSILASVGWNSNDDVFEREELWGARATPVDKQVNFMHDEMNIIGHMTESFGLDETGNLLSNDLTSDKLPDKFDVGVGFVLYTMWENEERAKLIDKVVAEIDSGNWFVSMECRFPNFDYAVVDKQGNLKTVARNEQTSFLSKYLRAYGGNGQYQDYKVGRLLRSLFFSGKGIVTNPANKRSIIFNKAEPFSSKGTLNLRENKMDEKEIAALKAKLEATEAQNKQLQTELTEKAKAAVNSEIESLKAQLTETAKATETAKSELAEANKNLSLALNEAKDLKDSLAKANEEVGKMKAEAVKSNRIAQLVKAGLKEDKATEVYTKWQSVADEQFADVVALHAKAIETDTLDEDEDAKNAKAAKDAEDAEKKMKEEFEAKEKAKADLAKAELEKSRAGNSSTEMTNDMKNLAGRLANFMPRARAAAQTK